LNDGSSKHTYGGALFELSNIPREHCLYDMYIYTLIFARGWFLQLPAGAYGHRLGTYFPRVSFMLIFLSSHFDSRIFCAQFAHVPTVGNGLAQSATGQLNFGHGSANFGHGSAQSASGQLKFGHGSE
jgi:hypothetical protein